MIRKSICSHCSEEIPHSVWICPACGGWVADVTRYSPTISRPEGEAD